MSKTYYSSDAYAVGTRQSLMFGTLEGVLLV